MEKKYGYARVSTKDQNLERQLVELRKYVEDERDIITDKESGKNFDRPGYRILRDTLLRRGDTLIVKSLDRLGRNKEQIKSELEYFKREGIVVHILDLPTTMAEWPKDQAWVQDMINSVLIDVLAAFAEQERVTIRQRQAEGIAAAKAQGKRFGRPEAGFPSDWARVYGIWKSGGISAVQAMKELGLKRSTFYKLVRKWEAVALCQNSRAGRG